MWKQKFCVDNLRIYFVERVSGILFHLDNAYRPKFIKVVAFLLVLLREMFSLSNALCSSFLNPSQDSPFHCPNSEVVFTLSSLVTFSILLSIRFTVHYQH